MRLMLYHAAALTVKNSFSLQHMELQKALCFGGRGEALAGCSESSALFTCKCSLSHQTGTLQLIAEVGVAKRFGVPDVTPVEIRKLSVYAEVMVLSSSVNSVDNALRRNT